jgi:hypothetical protein
LTQLVWPTRGWPTCRREATSHSRTVLLVLADATLLPSGLNASGSPGALLRQGPLRTARATRRSTRLKQPAWAGRHQRLLVGAVRSVVWMTPVAVGMYEAVFRPGAAVCGDGLVGQRLADALEPGLPLGAGVRGVVHV